MHEDGWELVNADVVLIGEEPRLAPHRDAMRARLADALGVEPDRVAVRATTTDGLGFTGRREGLAAQAVALLGDEASHPHARRARPARHDAAIWPAFMSQDQVVSTLLAAPVRRVRGLPALGRRRQGDGRVREHAAGAVGRRCRSRAGSRLGDERRRRRASRRRCARSLSASRRNTAAQGVSAVLLRRMGGLAAAHGLDSLIAPVRPTWKERYPLTPIERYVLWRREDGYPYDPWLRTHERVGAEILEACAALDDGHGLARRVGGVDGPAVPRGRRLRRPGRARPGAIRGRAWAPTSSPNVWMRHQV